MRNKNNKYFEKIKFFKKKVWVSNALKNNKTFL